MYKYFLIILILILACCLNIKLLKAENEAYATWGPSRLHKSWDYYKKTFISEDGRVIDFQKGSITTSEGQAYAMLRAVLIKDKETFDKVHSWTKQHLKKRNDNLLAWLWGEKTPKTWGIIDYNSASDADIEYATALMLAYKVWKQDKYLEEAKKVVNDIWEIATIEIDGMRVLASGTNQRGLHLVEVNPSYFKPYAFKTFAKIDPKHDWYKLADSSYELVNYCIDNIPTGLPPDFLYIDRHDGKISFKEGKRAFSYDAIRVFYKFYIDYALTGDKRAEKLLKRSQFFVDKWQEKHKFYTNYRQSGELKDYNEALGSISLLLPSIKLYNSEVADEMHREKIIKSYNNAGYWGDPLDYYAQNLVWFGEWVYLDENNVKAYKY